MKKKSINKVKTRKIMILQRTTCAKQEIRTGNENLHYNDNILQL